MLLSARRVIVVAATAVASCVLLIAFWKASDALVPSWSRSKSTLQGLDPHWTSERLEKRFAYVQYATDLDYRCNAMINFSQLRRFAVEYDMVLIYPTDWDEDAASREARWMQRIRAVHPQVKLRPFRLLTTAHGDPTWQKSLTKFHAFALTEYSRRRSPALSRAYLVHFSDWPLPKPWKPRTQEQWESVIPPCPEDDVETEDEPRCADQLSWTSLCQDYDHDKAHVCDALSA
ncbi:hypothetical protein P170DRAFT_504541 [Aspergillus steynii IBT 23096]|uniref:Uncharacterized protein n=1 Tax=Aspergillus steynii IBT 23096 TaxID=1392250 RepID=A0A2I2GL71_9EURO|nr:uncharacterized protein P170DRAFT_504541 [Aspergillus steynii IBT 23096]PLB53599.1 hypothetical protein P170DRAFT_504541 [Aspergillus steynii IBT 23096]